MKAPKPVTAYRCEDGQRRHFKSIADARKTLGINATYLEKRINSGQPCKGWLVFTDDTVRTVQARKAIASEVNGYKALGGGKSSSLVSVRIDQKTVILVPAERWTPDYAERYREKLNRQPEHRGGDWRNLPSVKGGKR